MDLDVEQMETKWEQIWKKEPGHINFDNITGKRLFSIDTPPPTVSGSLHMGHAYSYPHQDIIARYKRMRGFRVFYPFGFDNNGLATERFVEKELKINTSKMELNDVLEACKRVSGEAIEKMKVFFRRAGMSADLDNAYTTYSKESWKIAQSMFLDLYSSGRAYREYGMTVKCTTCRTAISQIEMEDSQRETDFVYLKFQSEDGREIIIATTRPEMLSACVAIAVNPEDERIKEMQNVRFKIPLYGEEVPLISDSRVIKDKGTGAEMICTFGDQNDYEIWKEHNLQLKNIIDDHGRIHDGGILDGMKIDEARKKIKDVLKENGYEVKREKITHSVNTHERCGTPIEIGVSQQWYLKYLDLKDELIEQGRKIRWYPDFMRIRYENWITGLKWDWCISRQRFLGIPIPVFYCNSCNSVVIPPKERLPIDPRFENDLRCDKCDSTDLTPERDVLDTWFTSSISPTIAMNHANLKEHYPMSARFQGHDIITTWAFTTIYRSLVHYNHIPWNEIIISGNVFDSKGEKMSKSKGNVVYPEEIISKYGADATRLWAVSSSIYEDINLKDQELVRGKRTVVKIYNAIKLVSSLPEGGDRTIYKLPFNRWMRGALDKTIEKVQNAYDSFDISKARLEIDNLFWQNFCDNYLEMIKYYSQNGTEDQKNEIGRCAREFAAAIMKMYAPIIPFITEEAYSMLGMRESVHSEGWPEIKGGFEEDYEKFGAVLEIIEGIRKERSRLKSARETYKGFTVERKKIPDELDRDIIKRTLREDNIAFKESEFEKIEVLK